MQEFLWGRGVLRWKNESCPRKLKRERTGNSCEHLWKEETIIYTHRVRKREKDQGYRAAGSSTFLLISLLKT